MEITSVIGVDGRLKAGKLRLARSRDMKPGRQIELSSLETRGCSGGGEGRGTLLQATEEVIVVTESTRA